MGRAVFPPCCVAWVQTMMEVMKMMGPPSKGPVHTLLNSVPPLCIRPLLTHASARDSWTLSGKSGSVCLVGTLLLSPGSWCTQGFVCALQESVSQFCGSSGGSMVGLIVTSSKTAHATHRSAAPRAPAPLAGHCWPVSPQETLWHSKAGLTQSLWDLLVHTRVWVLQVSLAGVRFDSKHDFAPPTILLVSPLPLDTGYPFLVGSNILLLMVVEQRVVSLEFSQEKMSAYPSTLPSWHKMCIIITNY